MNGLTGRRSRSAKRSDARCLRRSQVMSKTQLRATLLIAMLVTSSGVRTEPATDLPSVIADAMSAAPRYISMDATIMGRDGRILRKGSTQWTCLPSQPGVPGRNPMCADPETLQFFMDLRAGKTSNIAHIGVSYMLRGETAADFDDPRATEPPPGNNWYHAGPHVMFVFPADSARLLDGMPHDPATGEPYIRPMPDGNAPILVVPVAKPLEEIRTIRPAPQSPRK